MNKLICCALGHNLMPTGRRGFCLVEWVCWRCRGRFVSHTEFGYVGLLAPRGRYDGMKITVFKADQASDKLFEYLRNYEF